MPRDQRGWHVDPAPDGRGTPEEHKPRPPHQLPIFGRGRALEILLGGDDIPESLAVEYGYVNRVIPDNEIEEFADSFARRLAAFDTVAVAGIKKLVDLATLPGDQEFAAGLEAFFATAGRPQNLPFAKLLLENGLQHPDGIETDLGTAIGKLRQNLTAKKS